MQIKHLLVGGLFRAPQKEETKKGKERKEKKRKRQQKKREYTRENEKGSCLQPSNSLTYLFKQKSAIKL